jgi:hypothetical protein
VSVSSPHREHTARAACAEIVKQLPLAAAGFQIAQSELRGVVERLARSITERGTLFGDAGLVEQLFGVENRTLGRLKHGIHAPNDAHRKDDIRVLSTLEESDIVGHAAR